MVKKASCRVVYGPSPTFNGWRKPMRKRISKPVAGEQLIMADQPTPPRIGDRQFVNDGAIPRMGMSIPMPSSTKPPSESTAKKTVDRPESGRGQGAAPRGDKAEKR